MFERKQDRPPLASPPRPHRLLLVTQPHSVPDQVRAELDRRGFHVSVAKDGGQAHASFTMRKPDLVLLDVLLPGESGFEICEWMKKNEPGIPVVMLTVVDMEDARELARQVGAEDYLVAPCNLDVLLVRMEAANEAAWKKTHLTQPDEPGRIRFQCRCGKRLKVSAAHRGKSMSCPQCGDPLTVPRQSERGV